MISMKQFRQNESRIHKVSESAIAMRIMRGSYLGLKLKRLNSRVVFVLNKSQFKSRKIKGVGTKNKEIYEPK